MLLFLLALAGLIYVFWPRYKKDHPRYHAERAVLWLMFGFKKRAAFHIQKRTEQLIKEHLNVT